MARQMRMASAKNSNRKSVQVTNKYAVYMARQESAEIDNALFTLNRIQCSSQQKNTARVTVRASIVAQK